MFQISKDIQHKVLQKTVSYGPAASIFAFENQIQEYSRFYLFKVNIRSTKKRCKICLELTIRTPEEIIDVLLVSLLLTISIFHSFF